MQQATISQALALLFLASPALFAGVVMWAKPRVVLAWVDAFDAWVVNAHPSYYGKMGYIKKFFYKPVLWAFQKIVLWTQNISDSFMRCGVRIASYLYVAAICFGVLAYLALIVISTLLVVLMVIAAVFLALLILGAMLGGGSRQKVYDQHGNLIGTIEKD